MAIPPPHVHVTWLLASTLSRALGSPVTLPLQPCLSCGPEHMEELQPLLLPGGYDPVIEAAAQVGSPTLAPPECSCSYYRC